MKTKLLHKIRKDIRITDYKYGFYGYEMYYNFKWIRQGSFHFLSDILKEVHYIMRHRMKRHSFALRSLEKAKIKIRLKL